MSVQVYEGDGVDRQSLLPNQFIIKHTLHGVVLYRGAGNHERWTQDRTMAWRFTEETARALVSYWHAEANMELERA